MRIEITIGIRIAAILVLVGVVPRLVFSQERNELALGHVLSLKESERVIQAPPRRNESASSTAYAGAVTATARAPTPPAVGLTKGPRRYLSFHTWGWGGGAQFANFKKVVDTAEQKGFNTISLAFPWDTVEPSPNRFQFYWLDQRVDYIVSKGLALQLRVDYITVPEWIGSNDRYFMKAENGRTFRMPGSGRRMLAIADTQLRAWMGRLLEKVVQRYQDRYAAKPVLYYSIPFSHSQESEYSNLAYLDYSPQARADFQQWLRSRYVAIGRLNKRWGASHPDFSQVAIPRARQYKSGAWVDWIKYRTFALKRLIDQLADTLHSADANANIGVQFGSIWDSTSGARGTYDAASLIENVDWIIVDDAPFWNHKFSMDLLRTMARGKGFGNEIGFPMQTPDQMLAHGFETFAYGGGLLHFALWDNRYVTCNKLRERDCDGWKLVADQNVPMGIERPKYAAGIAELALAARQPVSIIEEPRIALYISTMAQYLPRRAKGAWMSEVPRGIDTYAKIRSTYRLLSDGERKPVAILTDGVFTDDPSVLEQYTQGIYIPSVNQIVADDAYAALGKARVPIYAEDELVGTRNEYGDARAPVIFKPYPAP